MCLCKCVFVWVCGRLCACATMCRGSSPLVEENHTNGDEPQIPPEKDILIFLFSQGMYERQKSESIDIVNNTNYLGFYNYL